MCRPAARPCAAGGIGLSYRAMLTARRHRRTCPEFLRAEVPSLPAWVHALFDDAQTPRGGPTISTSIEPTNGVELSVRRSDKLMLVTVLVRDAVALAPLMLQRRTAEAYETIRARLTTGGRWHPIRIWNFIPDIHGTMPGGFDRYMVFNAGRYAAYYDWYNGGAQFEALIATATGVGYAGKDLIVNVLASGQPGTPVENPRQVRAYRYSARYGPMPPCFARATILPPKGNGETSLLIGGTSSVRGESSMHKGDVIAQTRETLVNIAHLIDAAKHNGTSATRTPDTADKDVELRHLDSMRIYFTQAEHLDAILRVVWPLVDHLALQQVDVVRATICRPDLLVEIEGTASID